MSNLAEPIGEAWMTGDESRFASGPYAGQKLGDVWPAMSVEWKGASLGVSPVFPLLIKFIFAEDKLSVQVHPDDEYASQHEQTAGGRGKTEMWYAVRARPDAEVLVGLRPGVTRQSFERAIADGTAENCLERVPLKAGDAVFVPARTAHTIGPGLVLCEIQQNSDITYRVYDYNRRDAKGRSRELHVEKALDVIRFGEQRGGKIQAPQIHRGPVAETRLAACEYFTTERWEFGERIECVTSPEHFEVLIFLEGNGTIRWGDNHEAYGPAQVWLLPASLGTYELSPAARKAGAGPRTSLLRTHVPNN
ncbi:MAG TPA: type I phosphomannose isomerase catalytic subunit [Candidatus Acidoferrales bacterium]|nr:type I phosphomannose isomerase catalytic subunit [Candidatus Acidoferrales bacterium]